ncbi:50S ribosomal protein L9 [Sphingorhabdus lutea]|uniref:50S ribosomal protein L9 n=1 Tax=Sphingorhabdus lutea TaxID=1913578 RepID=UPI0009F88934|nr:50S ribosomal protein L9 [Sphingorhabdus lutea]
MDIILLERVEKLGSIGDVVTVKDGYARNFLLPNKKALRANAVNKKLFEANRAKIEADNEARRAEAEKESGNVDGKQVVLIRAASNSGQLYGSVSVRDIVDSLAAQNAVVNRSMVILERPIKELGVYEVRVVLHPEVSVTISVNVARSEDEAEMQKDGINVIDQMFEEEQAEIAATTIQLQEDREAAADEAEEADAARVAALAAAQAAAAAAASEGLSAEAGEDKDA